ncbi:hypothetical protein J8273_1275 [Carpediemonas membranifera]|uniref:Uncharacterized protein n=1 Tax=Carpediemonas membranifera TaxID=201153 RepID=A0A8J6E1Y4_9EUKA|nr:hypothetical protein J8273_1275 [Carpediemonas membranifera]|eukprot:KAG9396939.1 hypothetical protein J8273_1275 [Carpediemonas membranifera]
MNDNHQTLKTLCEHIDGGQVAVCNQDWSTAVLKYGVASEMMVRQFATAQESVPPVSSLAKKKLDQSVANIFTRAFVKKEPELLSMIETARELIDECSLKVACLPFNDIERLFTKLKDQRNSAAHEPRPAEEYKADILAFSATSADYFQTLAVLTGMYQLEARKYDPFELLRLILPGSALYRQTTVNSLESALKEREKTRVRPDKAAMHVHVPTVKPVVIDLTSQLVGQPESTGIAAGRSTADPSTVYSVEGLARPAVPARRPVKRLGGFIPTIMLDD